MTKKSSGKASYKHRSAVTGQYVKENYAKKNPRTTVKEKVKK